MLYDNKINVNEKIGCGFGITATFLWRCINKLASADEFDRDSFELAELLIKNVIYSSCFLS